MEHKRYCEKCHHLLTLVALLENERDDAAAKETFNRVVNECHIRPSDIIISLLSKWQEE